MDVADPLCMTYRLQVYAARLTWRKEIYSMEDIRILTAGDSSLLIEFGHEINPEINRRSNRW